MSKKYDRLNRRLKKYDRLNRRLNKKVLEVFSASAGDRLERIDSGRYNKAGTRAIQAAMLKHGDFTEEEAHDIGFHLSDWMGDAAFLLAVYLYPEKFTKKEIDWGVRQVLVHAPHHIMAAATLHGKPLQDTFNLGVRIEPDDEPDEGT